MTTPHQCSLSLIFFSGPPGPCWSTLFTWYRGREGGCGGGRSSGGLEEGGGPGLGSLYGGGPCEWGAPGARLLGFGVQARVPGLASMLLLAGARLLVLGVRLLGLS